MLGSAASRCTTRRRSSASAPGQGGHGPAGRRRAPCHGSRTGIASSQDHRTAKQGGASGWHAGTDQAAHGNRRRPLRTDQHRLSGRPCAAIACRRQVHTHDARKRCQRRRALSHAVCRILVRTRRTSKACAAAGSLAALLKQGPVRSRRRYSPRHPGIAGVARPNPFAATQENGFYRSGFAAFCHAHACPFFVTLAALRNCLESIRLRGVGLCAV